MQRGPRAGLAPGRQRRVEGLVTTLLPLDANPADEIPKLLFKRIIEIIIITATIIVTVMECF